MNKLTSREKQREFYEQNFKPDDYIKVIEDVIDEKTLYYEEWQFLFRATDNVFRNPRVRGTKLLDIGCGPTVHNLIPACFYYSDIVVSDLVKENRQAVQKWLRKEPGALDWSKNIRNALEIHGYEDIEKGKNDVEDLIRKNVRAVIHCDVLADEIISPEYSTPYDLVMSSLALECACADYFAFSQSIKKINPLVKLGGFLVLKGFINGGYWKCGNDMFPHLKVSFKDVDKALKDAGFGKLDWQIQEKCSKENEYEFESVYCVRASKVKDCIL